MKTYKKGFVLPIVIIIFVLLAAGGTYIYVEKGKNISNKETNEVPSQEASQTKQDIQPKLVNPLKKTTITSSNTSNLKKYTHPSGLFTFYYPPTWTIRQGPIAVSFNEGGEEKGSQFHDLNISVSTDNTIAKTYEDQAKYLGHKFDEESVVLGGIVGQQLYYKETTAVQSVYIIPVVYNNSKVNIVIFATSKDGSIDWLDDVRDILFSLTIDPSKAPTVLQQADNVQSDANTKATLSGLRPAAEMYLDSHPNYSGLCSATSGTFYTIFSDLKGKTNNQVKCTDGVEYAASVKLPGGEYYCVDSTGYFNKISGLHSLKACTK
jgi:hypothetical protein